MANKYLDYDGLLYFWQKIKTAFVAQESGKGLSTNDYTTAEKNKLSGIEAQANKTVVDSAMSSSSTNPVQNNVVKSYVDNAISGITQFDYQVVASLPATGTKGVIYLVSHGGSGTEIYDEYIWITSSSSYEKIGTTDVDLSNYLTDVAYDSTNNKFTKTKDGSTSDIVTLASLKTAMALSKSDVGLGNVDNTADANKAVLSATKLGTARKIDGVSFDGNSDIVHYATCSTGASTQAKTATCSSTISLETGARVAVKFSNGTTLPISTLKINSLDAKGVSGSVVYNAGDIIEFVYDGTNWRAVGYVTAMVASDLTASSPSDAPRTISPNLLVSNFPSVAITNSEIDTIMAS